MQYTAGLYVTCQKSSGDFKFKKGDPRTSRVIIMKRIEKSLSEGRKIFRLFKFVDEFSETVSHAWEKKNKKLNLFREILFYAGQSCSFMYYLLDNIVWFSSIKVISKYIAHNYKWKEARDFFSLGRCVFSILSSFSFVVDLIKVEMAIFKKFDKYNSITIT